MLEKEDEFRCRRGKGGEMSPNIHPEGAAVGWLCVGQSTVGAQPHNDLKAALVRLLCWLARRAAGAEVGMEDRAGRRVEHSGTKGWTSGHLLVSASTPNLQGLRAVRRRPSRGAGRECRLRGRAGFGSSWVLGKTAHLGSMTITLESPVVTGIRFLGSPTEKSNREEALEKCPGRSYVACA